MKDVRVLIAELQRIASHLVWLGTHALEIGAVSVMMYCFRERELLLNINELIAGFRMFPSYLRIGGLREDLPPGFHEAVNAFLDRFPSRINEFEDLLTKNQIWLKRTRGVGVLTAADTMAYGLVGPIARASGVAYDVRKVFPYSGYETFDFDVPSGTAGDVYERYLVRMAEMRQSVRSPSRPFRASRRAGIYDIQDYQIVPPPKDKVYSEMEALIQHFLVYSQGFTVPRGESYVPVEGSARRARLLHRLGRIESSVSHQAAGAELLRLPGPAEDDRGWNDCRRHRRHRIDGRRDGRRGSMSFHPLMPYGEGWHKSDRVLLDEGAPFAFTAERAAALEEICGRYPSDQRKSAVLGGAVPGAGAAGLSHRERDASRGAVPGHHAGGGRGRRDLLCDVLQGARRQVRAAGVSHAVVRAGRCGARDGSPEREAGASRTAERIRPACSRCSSSSAWAPAIERPVVMVNNEHWHERATPESCAKLVDDLKARGAAALSGCHLKVE